MPGTSRKTGKRTYEVLVSFSALNKGERFTQDADDLGWAVQHAETGYLRDVTEEVADVRGEDGNG
jgi:hypothetical protein